MPTRVKKRAASGAPAASAGAADPSVASTRGPVAVTPSSASARAAPLPVSSSPPSMGLGRPEPSGVDTMSDVSVAAAVGGLLSLGGGGSVPVADAQDVEATAVHVDIISRGNCNEQSGEAGEEASDPPVAETRKRVRKRKMCKFLGCDKKARPEKGMEGYCQAHFTELVGALPRTQRKKARKPCKLPGCEKNARGEKGMEGYCQAHFTELVGVKSFPKPAPQQKRDRGKTCRLPDCDKYAQTGKEAKKKVAPKPAPKAASSPKAAAGSPKGSNKGKKLSKVTPTPPRTGMWADEEHDQFKEGVVLYGWSNWIGIATCVPSRERTQVKSHGQKFMKQHQKECEALIREHERLQKLKKGGGKAKGAKKGASQKSKAKATKGTAAKASPGSGKRNANASPSSGKRNAKANLTHSTWKEKAKASDSPTSGKRKSLPASTAAKKAPESSPKKRARTDKEVAPSKEPTAKRALKLNEAPPTKPAAKPAEKEEPPTTRLAVPPRAARSRAPEPLDPSHELEPVHKTAAAPKLVGEEGPLRKRKRCKLEGCEKEAQSGKEGYCCAHFTEFVARVVKPKITAARKTRLTRGRICSVPGCPKQVQNGGLCCSHGAKTTRAACSADGCTNTSKRGGLCRRHGAFELATCARKGCKRVAVHGNFCNVHTETCANAGCRAAATSGYYCQRHYVKPPPRKKTVAPKNRTKSAKRAKKSAYTGEARINAAISAVQTRYYLHSTGAEGDKKLSSLTVRGVTQRPSGKWQAQVFYAKKSRYIGVFPSRTQAILAYEVAREVLGQESSVGVTEKSLAEARKAAFKAVSLA